MNKIFIKIEKIYVVEMHIWTLSQIATLSVTNRDTHHKLPHRHKLRQSQIATQQVGMVTAGSLFGVSVDVGSTGTGAAPGTLTVATGGYPSS